MEKGGCVRAVAEVNGISLSTCGLVLVEYICGTTGIDADSSG